MCLLFAQTSRPQTVRRTGTWTITDAEPAIFLRQTPCVSRDLHLSSTPLPPKTAWDVRLFFLKHNLSAHHRGALPPGHVLRGQ